MAELKLPRLLAAAKEFNIGQDTLIDFLIGKSFPKDDLKPTSKLTEEMYRALQQEFQSDKAAKMKSDQVDLPKGSQAETKKKKEDEEINFRKEDKKVAPKIEEPVIIEEKIEPKQEEPAPKEEEEIVKIDAPEISSLRVIDKIDLSAIDSSTRPKKVIKKKADQVAETPAAEEKAEEKAKPAHSESPKKGTAEKEEKKAK
ncbi:MAG: translation initiation factor IF-2, partial [Chitinophagaceae bacterium]